MLHLIEFEIQIKTYTNTGKHETYYLVHTELLKFDLNDTKAQKYFRKSQKGLQEQNLKTAYGTLKQNITKHNGTIRG